MEGPTIDGMEAGLRAGAPAAPRGLDRALGLERVLQALRVVEAQPTRIGRYVVHERLGQGGMGAVYRAADPELGRDVAIKVLLHEVGSEQAAVIRDEAATLARLAHPNVVTIYDLGVKDEQLYLVMQYVDGADLGRHLLAHPTSSWREPLEMLMAAGRGLAAAHEAGVIHRDFKPENVLVGGNGEVKLADFGLARRTDERGIAGEIAGTFDYMPPEVRRGEPADAFSDQYSFCAAAWRIIDPSSSPGADHTTIDTAVARCLRRGLHPERYQRWHSMSALLQALGEALVSVPYDRQRAVLIDRVERAWIDGVLRRATEEANLPLHFVTADDHVESPLTVVSRRDRSIDIDEALERGHGSLLVLGGPGAGKTTSLLMLADRLLHRARADPRAPVPVVLNLSSFAADAQGLRDWIEDELVAKYSLPRKSVAGWLDGDGLALLLDGLDEVTEIRRSHCVRAINAFRKEHATPLVVVSRTDDYAMVDTRLAVGAAVEVQPLPAAVVRQALRWQGAREMARLFADEATARRLCTPLMISLLLRASASLEDGALELGRVYAAYVEQAFRRHGVETAERERVVGAVRWLAAATERRGASEIWLEQLGVQWFRRVRQRILGGVLGVLAIVLPCVGLLGVISAILENDAFSGGLLGLMCAIFVLIFNRGLQVKPVGRLRWSWRRSARWLPIAAGIGLALGALYGLFYVVWVNVLFGGTLGLVCALSIGLEPAILESPVRPNQGIIQSGVNAVLVGGVAAIVGGALLGYGVLPPMLPHLEPESTLYALEDPSLTVFAIGGAAVGITIAMIHGGAAVLLHAALRITAALTTPLPLRVVPLLEQAVRLGLMRRVGGGYIFLHRTLQQHFVLT